MNTEDLITRVLHREGGWVDRAEDKGGPTNRGITLATYTAWRMKIRERDLHPGDLKQFVDDHVKLSEETAREIYTQRYVTEPKLDLLGSEALREVMFDWIVNSGQAAPVKALQRLLGVGADGMIGADTAQAAATKDGTRLAQQVLWSRVEFIANWMRSDKRDADKDGVPDSMENAAGILLRIVALGRGSA